MPLDVHRKRILAGIGRHHMDGAVLVKIGQPPGMVPCEILDREGGETLPARAEAPFWHPKFRHRRRKYLRQASADRAIRQADPVVRPPPRRLPAHVAVLLQAPDPDRVIRCSRGQRRPLGSKLTCDAEAGGLPIERPAGRRCLEPGGQAIARDTRPRSCKRMPGRALSHSSPAP